MKAKKPSRIQVLASDPLAAWPEELRQALARVARQVRTPLYVAGGPVRDWLLGAEPHDLDFTVATGGVACARELSRILGGAFVLLDGDEDVARVVWQGFTVDFSRFRGSSATIEEDLRQRDFTINALALPFSPATASLASLAVIDPTGGLADLAEKRIRTPAGENLDADPLRLLRAYRFMACLDFAIAPATLEQIASRGRLLPGRTAMERIAGELALIFASGRAAPAVAAMAESGLLFSLFPELAAGRDLAQPSSHHLDVFGHSLETLRCLEELLPSPGTWFAGQEEVLAGYAAVRGNAALLAWAALFHDLGKPASHALQGERITFYNHDRVGARLFAGIASRLRWRSRDQERAARFISLHMWPFHLNNARQKTGISRRACLRLVKAMGEDLPGLFLLAMADSLAGQGTGKPREMEAQLADLFAEVHGVYEEHIRPVLSSPPLLSGHDLIRDFALTPGPVFRKILDGLEQARVEGEVADQDGARAWVAAFLRDAE